MGGRRPVPDHRLQQPEREQLSASDPVVRELLDHLAEELAREYVRLMEEAAKQADETDPVPPAQEDS